MWDLCPTPIVRIAWASKFKFQLGFPDFKPNPGPGGLPLHASRGDIEFVVCAVPVASLAISFVFESIFWNLVGKVQSAQTRSGSLK